MTSAEVLLIKAVLFSKSHKIRHNINLFRSKVGHWPNFLFPETYNEKMLWRKLFERNPAMAVLSDKLKVKDYFKQNCPNLNVINPLWVGKRVEDIPEDLLQQDVIIKTNHGSGFNIIVKDRALDRKVIDKKVRRWLRKTYGVSKLEWAYSQIDPHIIIEPVVRPDKNDVPFDFDFEVCNGRVHSCFVLGNKASGHPKIGIFDRQGRRLEVTVASVPSAEDQLPSSTILPPSYHQAVKYAEILGKGFDNVRVDFMCINNELYGCEMTFYSMSGFGNIYSDPELYKKLSNTWDLRKSWFLSTPQSGWRKCYAAELLSKKISHWK